MIHAQWVTANAFVVFAVTGEQIKSKLEASSEATLLEVQDVSDNPLPPLVIKDRREVLFTINEIHWTSFCTIMVMYSPIQIWLATHCLNTTHHLFPSKTKTKTNNTLQINSKNLKLRQRIILLLTSKNSPKKKGSWNSSHNAFTSVLPLSLPLMRIYNEG